LAQYRVTVNATSNATAPSGGGTEDTWIEMFPPANVAILLKRIRISFPHTAVSDVPARVRITRSSAAGATGTSYTPVKTRPAAPASVTTVNIKNGTTAFSVGTVVDVVLDSVVNTRGIFEWVARDETDFIVSGVNQRLNVLLRTNLASMVCNVECDYEE
jgi:hypothetical protein